MFGRDGLDVERLRLRLYRKDRPQTGALKFAYRVAAI
jgi:hypothetical protein